MSNNTGLIIGIAALAIGGWCFLAGPCKDMLSQKASATTTGSKIVARPQDAASRPALYTTSGYRY